MVNFLCKSKLKKVKSDILDKVVIDSSYNEVTARLAAREKQQTEMPEDILENMDDCWPYYRSRHD